MCGSTTNHMPAGKEGEGGNFRGAFHRVRLVIEQASHKVERNGINNHSHGGYSGAQRVEETFERSGAPEYPPGESLTTIFLISPHP